MHRTLFIMVLLLTTFHGASSSAEEPGQLPTPLHEQTDATTSISSTQSAMSELPERRYPMLNRPLEVAFQGGAGLALTAVPTFMGLFLLQVDGTIYPTPPPNFVQDTGEALLTSLIFTVPSSTLAVWGLGACKREQGELAVDLCRCVCGRDRGFARVWRFGASFEQLGRGCGADWLLGGSDPRCDCGLSGELLVEEW